MKAFFISILILTTFYGFSQSNTNWTQMNTNGMNSLISNMVFVDSIHGFALNGSNLIESSDAGQNWLQSSYVTTTNFLERILKKGDSLFITSVDSNSNYGIYSFNVFDSIPVVNYTATNEIGDYLHSLEVFNSQFLGIENQKLVVSNNLSNKTVIKSNQIEAFRFQKGYLSCTNSTHMFFSIDTGKTWDSASYNNLQQGVQEIQTYFFGGDTIYSIGRTFPAKDLISFDRGNNWNSLSSLGGGRKPYKYYFINNRTIIGNFHGVILTSTDYGVNFNSDTLFYSSSFKYSIYQYSDSVLFFYGYGGIIYKSTNAGGIIGVQELDLIDQIQVYPNPVSDVIQLKYNNTIILTNIELYSIDGKSVKRFKQGLKQLDIAEIPKGNYILKVNSNNRQFSKKIIIL